MDKSQGRVLARAVPGRRGRGGTLYFRGGHFITGGRLLRDDLVPLNEKPAYKRGVAGPKIKNGCRK